MRDAMVRLVDEYGIAFVRWDHNRDLIDAGSTRAGRAGVHAQTLAAYRLMAELREACPGLEIEACSSGGARVDLGVLEHADRVWASDCIDAHERQQIQRWTAQLLPPELVGSHVGGERAHTTGRRLDLPFRAATALFGHFGIEWDLAAASPAERRELAGWVALYKRHRALIHAGRVVRRSADDDSLWLHGAVSPSRDEALYALTLRERPVTWPSGRVRLPGLDADTVYRVRAVGVDVPPANSGRHPGWWDDGARMPGRALATIGLDIPALDPDTSVVLHVVAEV